MMRGVAGGGNSGGKTASSTGLMNSWGAVAGMLAVMKFQLGQDSGHVSSEMADKSVARDRLV